MRTYIGLAALLAVVALGGCEQIKSTAGKIRDQMSSSSASSSSYVMPHNLDVNANYVARQMAEEARTIAATPGFAQRSGDRLVITYDGKPVAEFTAPNAVWTYKGLVELANANGRIEPFALVYIDEGEIGYTSIIRRDGSLVMLDSDLAASPDGQFIASGYGDIQYDTKMRVVAWNGGGEPQSFELAANCAPVDWQDNRHFTASCVRDEDDSFQTLARVSRGPNGEWTLSETREIANGKPMVSDLANLKLRILTATAKPLKIDEDMLYAQKYGYRRLTP